MKSITFGKRLSEVRKEQKISQDLLAKKIGVHGEMKPSIETAKKLADALEVTLDYLVADGELRNLDKKTLQRLEDISKLPTEDRNNIFYTLDNLIKAAKLKAI